MSDETLPARRDTRFERLSRAVIDRVNPLVLKEIRQALRGKNLVIWVLVLAAFGAGVALLFARMKEQNPDRSDLGVNAFTACFGILLFIGCGLVPLNAFFNLAQELKDRTLELVGITRLSPYAIMRGKILSPLIQTSIVISVLLPFFTFAYLLGGIDIISILVLLMGAALESVWLTVYALFLAAIAPNNNARMLMGGSLAIGTVFGVILVAGGTRQALRSQRLQQILRDFLQNPDVLWPILGGAFFIASYAALFYVLAAGRISFKSANTSTAPRAVLLAQWIGVTAITLAVFEHRDGPRLVPMAYGFLLSLQWQVVSVYAGSESEELSQRIRRSRERASLFVRGLLFLLYPGGRRGLAFSMLLSSLSFGIAFLLLRYPWHFCSTWAGPRVFLEDAQQSIALLLCIWLYSMAFVVVPLLICRLVFPYANPKAQRTLLGLMLPACLILSLFGRLMSEDGDPLSALNPFTTAFDMREYGFLGGNLFLLQCLAFVVAVGAIGCFALPPRYRGKAPVGE